VKHPFRHLGAVAAALFISVAAPQVFAHGDVTPQAVDTTGLKDLGADFLKSNPYRKDKTAIRIGSSAYNQNCARCHGLEAISGGIAPDLRYLPLGDDGDEIFLFGTPFNNCAPLNNIDEVMLAALQKTMSGNSP